MNKSEAKRLPSGKLPLKLLDRLLKKYTKPDKSVIIGPSVGLDSTVIDFGGRFLVAKTDPITFTSEDIGLYAVYINANDIAVMGGRPRWFLATLLLPEGKTTEEGVEKIFSRISRASKTLGISFCGGHTEITRAVRRPVVIGQMLGMVDRRNLRSSAGARVSDDIILTKGIAIEAASVIAREKGRELKKAFSPDFLKRVRGFVRKLSVVKDAQTALKNGDVHAMHDPTEGGLSMGLYELAIASGVGVTVEKDKIPFVEESLKLLEFFGLDPMGSIASGALLLTVCPRDTEKIIRALKKAGIKSSCIGHVTDRKNGMKVIEGGKLKPLKIYQRDELARLF